MITEKDIDDMDLPKANVNEELETLSENYLLPLFEPSKFELCTKDKRDKGIDFTYEIKRNNKHTGFRFILQLKATESICPNKSDGSFSKSIETSNINALLNNGSPAFYVLFDATTKTFYYESLLVFFAYISNNALDWGKQGSHVLRFSKKLSSDGIDLIYDTVLKHGIRQRDLVERSVYISSGFNKSDRISIDADFTVTDDAEIRKLIEHLGFDLLNEGKWREILLMHKRATGNVAKTSLYNLILGIANYYEGSRWDALSFLNTACNLQTGLNEELKMLLSYFDTTIRYSIGIFNEE
jgi:hypothetical protein